LFFPLALKNLKSRKARTALTAAGIAIGIASLTLTLALGEGLRQAAFRNLGGDGALTQLTVQLKPEKGTLLKLLPLGQKQMISPQQLEQVRGLAHVKEVWPEMIFANISSLQVSVTEAGLQTDSMIFGVPYGYVAQDVKGSAQSWDKAGPPYPALISQKILDIYNFTVAPTSGLPTISEKDLGNIDITLLPGQSTFFPQLGQTVSPVSARIIGFSDKTSLVGVTIPLEAVRQMNLQANPSYTDTYLRLHVQVDKAENVATVRDGINRLGLDAVSPLEEIKAISENFLVVEIGLGLIGLIILFVAGLMIASTFLSAVSERSSDIGLFRALGATRSDIRKIFLAEASVIGLLGGVCGILAGIICGLVLENMGGVVPIASLQSGTLFIFNPLTMLLVLAFAVILSTIFALLPAVSASRLDPLEALSGE
jgi:putative ABC transport system permease protein